MKLIIFILMINLSVFSMENKSIINAQQTAFEYLEIVKKNLASSKLEPGSSAIGSCLGLVVTPEEFDNYFFDIDIDAIEYLPQEIKTIYNFLQENKLLQQIGIIHPKKLLEAKIVHKNLRLLKKELISTNIDFEDSEKIHILVDNNTPNKFFFHYKKTGFLLRDKASVNELEKNELFLKNDEVTDILYKVSEINKTIKNKLNIIHAIINRNFIDDNQIKEALNNLAQHDEVPEILKPLILEKIRLINNPSTSLEVFRKLLKNNLEVNKSRQIGLDIIASSPFDLLQIYFFYLFEEAKKNIKLNGLQDSIDFINSFNDIEELSVTAHLAPYAHQVMESLGIDVHKYNVQKKTPTKIKSNNKKNKNKNKKKKKNNKTKKLIEITVPTDMEPLNVEPELPKKTYADLFRGIESASMKNNLVQQISPTQDKLSEKGHRLMDTLARLLSREIGIGIGDSAGSISLAIIPNNYATRLIISTKSTRSNGQLILALQNIIKYSNILHNNTGDLKEYIKSEKQKIADITIQNTHTQKQARQNIDKIKLAIALNGRDDADNIELLLVNILNNINEQNVTILDNPFNLHAELNIINYLLLQPQAALGKLDNYNGFKNVPYQYIAGSILNCAKCHALINGGRGVKGINEIEQSTELVFLSRGSYHTGYPCFVIPEWSKIKNNNKTKRQIGLALNNLSSPSSELSQQELSKIQDAELSDSDGE